MLAVSLSYMSFIMLRYVLSMAKFLRVFIMKTCILSNNFSASTDMIMWIFSFFLLICYIKFIDLHMLKHSHNPRINPTLSWCIILIICCWIQYASILLRIFLNVHKGYCFVISFPVMFPSGFGIRYVDFIEWIWKFPFNILEKFEKSWC